MYFSLSLIKHFADCSGKGKSLLNSSRYRCTAFVRAAHKISAKSNVGRRERTFCLSGHFIYEYVNNPLDHIPFSTPTFFNVLSMFFYLDSFI